LLPLIAACVKEPSALNDGADHESGCPNMSVADGSRPMLQHDCGGTATATGTSPLGTFSAGKIDITYYCGTIYVTVSDATGDARLTVAFPYAAGALGERSAGVTFNGPPRGDPLVQTTGSVTISAISDPLPTRDASIASGWGMVEGTFSVASGCLSITGSFASPYCAYDGLCG
jgi:hypothetical protein